MRRLLSVTAVIEGGGGAALMAAPSMTAMLLLGASLMEPAAASVARVGGAGLLALSVACWRARGDTERRSAHRLIVGLLLYNAGAVLVLGAAGLRSQTVGIALWPVVVLHVAMAAWCIVNLNRPDHLRMTP